MKTKQQFAKDYVKEHSTDGVNGPSRAKTVAEWTKPETAFLHGGGRFTEQRARDYYNWACQQVGLIPEPKHRTPSKSQWMVDEKEYEKFLAWKDRRLGKTPDPSLVDDKDQDQKVKHNRPYDKNAPKQPVNLSVSSDLVAKAKGFRINLSEALEIQLAELVATAERRKWLSDNAAAIEAYNKRVEEGTILSDFERPF